MVLRNMGADSVLIEGGALLNYAALKEGIVDEIHLTITPKLSGDRHAASVADGSSPLGAPFLDLKMVDCQPMDNGEVFLTYRLRR